jgi:hypothetical protein
MSTELESKITTSVVDGKLPCAVAFGIARELKVSLKEVGETADKLGILVSKCQLGCFP